MTRQQARQLLSVYRGTADDHDPEIREALSLAAQDPELQAWLERHLAFHAAMRQSLRQVRPPAALKEALLAKRKVVRPAFWARPPVWAAAAAAVMILAAVGVTLFRQGQPANGFATYQSRMVGTALRQYRMDILSGDMRQVRQFMADKGSPSDYETTPGLERLQLTGGGVLKWRNNPVTMVCFDRGDKEMLYLFVADLAAIKDPPPAEPKVNSVSDLVTVSWTRGGKVYLLAGPAEKGFRDKYL